MSGQKYVLCKTARAVTAEELNKKVSEWIIDGWVCYGERYFVDVPDSYVPEYRQIMVKDDNQQGGQNGKLEQA